MLGELFAIGATLCFVISNAIFKRVDTKVSPSQINAFRTIIGFLTYLIIALIVGQFATIFQFPPILWLWLALSFIFGQVLGDTAYFKAQEMLGTTLALAISMTFPIFTIIISSIMGEVIPVYFYGAMSMIVVGVIVIGISKNRSLNKTNLQDAVNESEIPPENEGIISEKTAVLVENEEIDLSKEVIEVNIGIVDPKQKSKKYLLLAIGIALFAAISWSVGIVLTNKAITDVAIFIGDGQYSSLLGNVVRFPIAASILSAMSIGDKKTKIKTWEKKTWLMLFLGAIIGTSIGAYLYTEAIFLVNASFVSIVGSSSPLFAIPISWLFNREKVTLIGLIGVLLTVGGVVMIFAFKIALN